MTDAPAPRRSRLKLAFGASLAVNLFLVGLVGGQVFSSEPDERPNRPRGYSLHPRVMMQALPEERVQAREVQAVPAEPREAVQPSAERCTLVSEHPERRFQPRHGMPRSRSPQPCSPRAESCLRAFPPWQAWMLLSDQ